MFLLAFVAGWMQGHWWGFISRNYVVWPTFLLMNVFIALKGSHFWILFFLETKPSWFFFLQSHSVYLTMKESSIYMDMVSSKSSFEGPRKYHMYDCMWKRLKLSHNMTKPTKWTHPVWSESLLCAQWVAKDPRFLHVDSKGSEQTGRVPRLIWDFVGCTGHFVDFVLRRLICMWID